MAISKAPECNIASESFRLAFVDVNESQPERRLSPDHQSFESVYLINN